MAFTTLLIALLVFFCAAYAQSSCSISLKPSHSASVASGYQAALIATGLARPRGIQFDTQGHLLVVEAPKNGDAGIVALTLKDNGGTCLIEASRKTVVKGQGVSSSWAVSAFVTSSHRV
jgi:glucose/arabinose dehydrogenase